MNNELKSILLQLKEDIERQEKIKMEKERELVYLNDDLFIEKTVSVLLRLIDSIDEENYTRDELESIESRQTMESMDFFDQFNQKDARGRLIGDLNKGFYTKTNKDLILYIKNETGSCNKKNRLINYMPDSVLKFKIAMLNIVRVYDKKSKELGTDYASLSRKMSLLGVAARGLFSYMNGLMPEEAIVLHKNNIQNKNKVRTRVEDFN